jgi:hypothetical protein
VESELVSVVLSTSSARRSSLGGDIREHATTNTLIATKREKRMIVFFILQPIQ